jgi:hypothetical protein
LREDFPIFGQHFAEFEAWFPSTPCLDRLATLRVSWPLYCFGQPVEHDLKGRDPAGLAGFGYDDLLLNDVLQDRSDRTTAFGASLRIAAFAPQIATPLVARPQQTA